LRDLIRCDTGEHAGPQALASTLIGLYFSASWCPPCHYFAPILAQAYKQIRDTHGASSFEVVLIPLDTDENMWQLHMAKMPWMSLPLKNREAIVKLFTAFCVTEAPRLVILDSTGTVRLAGLTMCTAAQSGPGGYSAWSNWTGVLGLSEGQTGTIQRAGNKFLQAVDVAKNHAEKGFREGVSQVRAAVDRQMQSTASSSQPTHGRFQKQPSRHDLPSSAVSVRVCTWNLHGCAVDPEDDIRPWLFSGGKQADIYIVGIQELVELGPMSVLMNTDGHEERQSELEHRIEAALAGTGLHYLKVCSFGMVGLSLLAYALDSLQDHVAAIDCDRVKTGIEGLSGNKGGLCVRFMLGSMSLCFANVHLPSGTGKADERNDHLNEVLSYAFQGTSRNGSTRPAKNGFHRASLYTALEHDLTVVFGDLNSRLADLPDDGFPKGPPEAWLLYDELLTGRIRCARSLGFREAEVTFPPTYKYVVGGGDLSPARTPAWCDRVIYRFEPSAADVAKRVLNPSIVQHEVEVVEYDSYGDLRRTSDHRPIAATIRISIPDEELRA
ncbi:syj1, partial [Symbiodinium sp. CCMP2456]